MLSIAGVQNQGLFSIRACHHAFCHIPASSDTLDDCDTCQAAPFPRARLVLSAPDSPLYVVLHLSLSLSLSPSPSLWDEYWQWPALGFIHRSLSDPLWEKGCLCLSELNAEHLSSSLTWTQCETQRSQTVLIDVAPPPVTQRVENDFCYALGYFP